MSEHRAPTISTTHIHNVQKITMQRDLEHRCIDIVLSGSTEWLSTRISVWATNVDTNALPVIEMLDDSPAPKPEHADEVA